VNEHGAARRRTVVAFDGSALGWRSLDWAAGHAAAHDVPLLVVHCRQQRSLLAPRGTSHGTAGRRSGVPSVDRATAALFAEALERSRAAHPTLQVEGRLVRGSPDTELSAWVDPGDALVVGRSSRTQRSLGQSTADRLATHAPCEVVVFTSSDAGRSDGPFPGHVVAIIDGSEADESVLTTALLQAQAYEVPVAIVRTGGGANAGSAVSAPAATIPPRTPHESAGEQPSWQLNRPSFAVHSPAAGTVTSVLQDASRGAFLVVLPRGQAEPGLGAVVSCPVLVVPVDGSRSSTPSQVLPSKRSVREHS
jgi:nucleotide-binding universal stress UspA family protein